MAEYAPEKGEKAHDSASQDEGGHREDEIFDPNADVNFRTVSWVWASVIFLKSMPRDDIHSYCLYCRANPCLPPVTFATGIMSVPLAMSVIGAVPGSINLVGWCALNTYAGVIFGDFRKRHAGCHSVADMAGVIGGPLLRELAGALFMITWIVVSGSCIVGASTAFNAVSVHALCTNWFTGIAAIICIAMASIRTFGNLGWLTWAGFFATFIAIFIVV